MSLIIVKSAPQQQPQAPFRVRTNHWAGRWFYAGFANPWFLQNAKGIFQPTGLLPTPSPLGQAFVSNSSSTVATYSGQFTPEATEATWIFKATRYGAQPDSGFGTSLRSPLVSGAFDPFVHFIKDSGERIRINTVTGDESSTYWETAQDWVVNQPMIGAITWVSGSAPNVYRNGVLLSLSFNTGSRTGTLKASSTTQVNLATLRLNGAVHWGFCFSREFTAREVLAFTREPFRFLVNEPRRIFFDVGAATAYTLTTTTGTFTLTGNAANLLKGNVVLTATGSFVETGNAANLVKTSVLATAVGAFTETGNAANLTKQWALVAGVGSFVFTGNDATLSYSGDTHPPLVAASGSYTLTGNATGLAHGYVLTTEVGTFSETGNAANLKRGNSLVTETGSFILTGNDSTLTKASVLSLEKGTFIMTGRNANLIWSGAGGSTVEFFRGVSKAPDGGVSKTIHTLVDGGGGTYVVTESSGVSEDKTDSPNYEGYIIT